MRPPSPSARRHLPAERNGAIRLKVTQSSEVPLNGVVALVAAVPASLPLAFGAIGTVSYSLTLARGALVPTGCPADERGPELRVRRGKREGDRAHDHGPGGERNAAAVTGVNAGDIVVVNPPPGLLDGSMVNDPWRPRERQMKTTRDLQARIFDRINPAVRFSVTRYVFAIGVFVAIFAFGLISVLNLGVDQFPSINFPSSSSPRPTPGPPRAWSTSR